MVMCSHIIKLFIVEIISKFIYIYIVHSRCCVDATKFILDVAVAPREGCVS